MSRVKNVALSGLKMRFRTMPFGLKLRVRFIITFLHNPMSRVRITTAARPGRGCHLRRTDLPLLVSPTEIKAERGDWYDYLR